MARYLFSSHDGFGLGHVRRNSVIAAALRRQDPEAEVALITGVPRIPAWLARSGIRVVRVPSMVKDEDGAYRNPGMSFRDALAARAAAFDEEIRSGRPDVVVVDRHPYGIAGELRRGLIAARVQGAALVLGLRDVLDEPGRVRQEVHGRGWTGVGDLYSEVLVYGAEIVCDHRAEYSLPAAPVYCGWVTQPVGARAVDHRLLVVAAGGGGDGAAVYRLGVEVLRRSPGWRGVVVAGPQGEVPEPDEETARRLRVVRDPVDAPALTAGAGAVIQMAGYNSTVESLVAGVRPILVPRRSPRREQAIRAARLTALGLADMVDHGAAPEEVAWLLDRPRRLVPGAAAAAGVHLDGAAVAARRIAALAGVRS